MSEPVVVLGIGARTPVGWAAAPAAAAVRAGIVAYREHPSARDSLGEPIVVASALPEGGTGMDRWLALATPAAGEALLGLRARETIVHLCVGLPAARPGLPDRLAQMWPARFASELAGICRVGEVMAFPCGHASALLGLATAREKVERGEWELCLVGGVDSYLSPATLAWLEAEDQLHGAGRENNAWGFVPGEAAGFFLVGSQRAAKRAGLIPLGTVAGTGMAHEKNLIKTDSVCLGEGLGRALRGALKGLPEGFKLARPLCDLNGESYRAEEYGFAFGRLTASFVDVTDFIAPAKSWGDVGAASGALFVGLVISAFARACTSSEGGERAAVLLRKWSSTQ